MLTSVDSSVALYEPDGGDPISILPLRMTPSALAWATEDRLLYAVGGSSIGTIRRIPIVTEDDPYGRVVIRSSLELVHHPDVHVRVPEVLMGYLAGFEVEQDETFEEMVVEDQIHVQVF